jgi:glycosyltransferase involved in cell wall biosynthesis
MRLAVYTDYAYRSKAGVIYAERAFALFLAALKDHSDRLVLIGRSAGDAASAHYALPEGIDFAPLTHYASLASPRSALWALARSPRQMWRALDQIDVLWVLGPTPHAILLVVLGRLRRRTVVIGVRQDWPSYVRNRHPDRRSLHVAADVMEWLWRALGRRLAVVAVGPELSARYARAPRLLDLAVSLVPAASVAASPPLRDYLSELRILSVGRLDEEKNPLLMADVLALLVKSVPRSRMLVCGEGPLAGALASRLAELEVSDHAELLGYVPMGEGLLELYRTSHVLLHISLTEGFPQVLIEAFASGLPVVATAVGGVPGGVGPAALLIPPADAVAAVDALMRVIDEPSLRVELAQAGIERARTLTLEAQIERLAAFLSSPGDELG